MDIDGETRIWDYASAPNGSVGTVDMGADEFIDSDEDGMPNWWEDSYDELINGTDDSDGDDDGDSLTNLQEYNFGGTDPFDADTDDDGMPDDYEVCHGLNALIDDALGDKDNDGYSNFVEFTVGTEPDSQDNHPAQGYYLKYDKMGRLTDWLYIPATQIDFMSDYKYDDVGNRILKTVR